MGRYLLVIILFVVSLGTYAQTDSSFLTGDANIIPFDFRIKSNIITKVELSKQDSLKYSTPDLIVIIDKRMNLNLTPGLRYLSEALDDFDSDDLDYIESIEELVKYVRNDSVKIMANYMKSFILSTYKREAALKKVYKYFRKDSIECSAHLLLPENKLRDSIEQKCFEAKDVSLLLDYIERDTSYKWIREISRDSTLLSIKNASDDSLKLWVKNGRKESYRFWIKNDQDQAIGAWIQTTADKSLKILVDYDVYQQSTSEDKLVTKQPPIVLIDTSLYKFGKFYPYKRYYTKWRSASVVNIGLTQGHVSNWQEGGENSIAALLNIKAFCNYKYKTKSWENTINYRYGLMQTGGEQLRKTEDLMEYNSKFGLKFYNNWYFSTMFNFKTQITNGYNYLEDNEKEIVSRFMSPAYFIFSIGLDYKPSSNLSVLISPFTGKYTVVTDTVNVDPVKYGIEKGEMVKKELGSYVKTTHKWQIDNDIKIENEFGLFYGYEGKIDGTDIDWKMSLDMKINYFVTAKIFTHVLYDKTVSQKLQFKEILNIGVTYNF